MIGQRNNENDISTNKFLSLLDQDIARGNVMPLDARYLEELRGLVKDITVNIDERLPDEEGNS